MAVNSDAKGKKGEREFCNKMKEWFGLPLRRSQQYSGANNDADVEGVEGLHIEVKRRESLNVHQAIKQAMDDCPPTKCPIVAHRRSLEPWLITFRAEDTDKFIDALLPYLIERDLDKTKTPDDV